MIKLGDKVKDSITGFTGIVIGISSYLNGCVSMLVCSNELDSEGKEVSGWFDEQRVAGKSEEIRATAGGPQKRPPQLHP